MVGGRAGRGGDAARPVRLRACVVGTAGANVGTRSLTVARAGRPQFGIEHLNAEPLGVDLHSVGGCPCTRIAHSGDQSRRPRTASCTRLPSRTRRPRPAHRGHSRHPLPSELRRRPDPSHRRHVRYGNHAQRPQYTSVPSTTSSTSVPPAAGVTGVGSARIVRDMIGSLPVEWTSYVRGVVSAGALRTPRRDFAGPG